MNVFEVLGTRFRDGIPPMVVSCPPVAVETCPSIEPSGPESNTAPESISPVLPEDFPPMFEAVIEELAETYREGTRDFLIQYHPNLVADLQQAYDAINDAWSKNDSNTFHAALEMWRKLHLKGIQFYEQTTLPELVKNSWTSMAGQAPYLMAPIRETEKVRFFRG